MNNSIHDHQFMKKCVLLSLWLSFSTHVVSVRTLNSCGCHHHVSYLLPRPRRGLRGIVFTRSVCLSVCLSVCVSVCPANILVFYFSAIRRDIDLKFIQDTYMVVLNSLK